MTRQTDEEPVTVKIPQTEPGTHGRTAPSWPEAGHRFAGSAVEVVRLLARHQLRWPRAHVGDRLQFQDGTTSRVFRETILEVPAREPALLVVQFRLRVLGRARLPHRLFRAESIANTPLFAGFPGFRSKLWLCDDATGTYRGIYEWDGADRATAYAETLSMLLRPVCAPGSVMYQVVAGTRRDEYLTHPESVPRSGATDRWWQLRSGWATADHHLTRTEKGSP
jgi:hypothetical protein